MINANFRNLFFALETFEQGLNVLGYIPLIGNISAHVRSNYAKIEAITGIGLAIFAACLNLQGNLHSAFYLAVGVSFVGHAILNGIRSYWEDSYPGFTLFTALPYDVVATFFVGRRFFPYIL